MKIRPDGTAVEICCGIGGAAAGVAAFAEAISEGQTGRRVAIFSAGNAARSLAPCGGPISSGGGIGTGPAEPARMTGAGAARVVVRAAATLADGAVRIPPGFGAAAAYWAWTARGSLAKREDPISPHIAASATLMLSSFMIR